MKFCTFLFSLASALNDSSSEQEKMAKSNDETGCHREPASYAFNASGLLRNVKTGEKFHFTTQAEYERLGEWVTEQVFKKITQPPIGLKKVILRDQEDEKQEDNEDQNLGL